MKVFALVIVAALLPATISAQIKPIKEELLHVDTAPLPSTPTAIVSAATAIVVAKYTGKLRVNERKFSDDGPVYRSTAYTFQIQDLVKLHQYVPFVGSELDLELPGGDKEFPTYVLREKDPDTAALIPGHTYLLCLGWNRYDEKLVFAFGAGGIYDITEGQLVALNKHGRMFDGTSAAAFVAALRAAAK